MARKLDKIGTVLTFNARLRGYIAGRPELAGLRVSVDGDSTVVSAPGFRLEFWWKREAGSQAVARLSGYRVQADVVGESAPLTFVSTSSAWLDTESSSRLLRLYTLWRLRNYLQDLGLTAPLTAGNPVNDLVRVTTKAFGPYFMEFDIEALRLNCRLLRVDAATNVNITSVTEVFMFPTEILVDPAAAYAQIVVAVQQLLSNIGMFLSGLQSAMPAADDPVVRLL